MNRSEVALASFGTNNEFKPTCRPVILGVRRSDDSLVMATALRHPTSKMNERDNKPKRWRLRFTMRFLVIALTLVCICLAAWPPLQRFAFDDVRDYEMAHFDSSGAGFSSPFPLLVSNDGIGPSDDAFDDWTLRRYYLWFFGYVVRLPYERKLK